MNPRDILTGVVVGLGVFLTALLILTAVTLTT